MHNTKTIVALVVDAAAAGWDEEERNEGGLAMLPEDVREVLVYEVPRASQDGFIQQRAREIFDALRLGFEPTFVYLTEPVIVR